MKKLTLLGITVSALLLSNCSNEEVMQEQDALKIVELSASINESAPRAAITNQGAFSWSETDQISVHTSCPSPVWQTFTLQGKGGEASGTFQGGMYDGYTITSCAVHPANLTPSLTGNKLKLTLPSSYTFKEKITNVVMMAYIKDAKGTLAFRHLGGVFRFIVKNIPAAATQFVFVAKGKKLTGEFAVDDITATTPEIATSNENTGMNNSVTINFTASSSVTERIFYVPVPTGEYGNLSCVIKNAEGESLTTMNIADSKKVERCDLKLVPTITCTSVEGGVAVNVSSTDALSNALSTATSSTTPTTITVSETLSKAAPATISAPISNSSSNPIVTIAFDAIPATSSSGISNAIKVTDGSNDGTSSGNESKGTVEIAIPQRTAEGEKPKFEVFTPNATAILSATGESAEYGETEALTSGNTLIVNKGVTVEKLTVKGGNVKIYGTVTNLIIDSTSSNTTKVLVYPGASCTQFTDNRESGKITPSYVPGDSGENEGYTGGDVTHEWD